MRLLIRMAWRNLRRHGGRTFLSVLAVFMGVFVVVVAKGLVDGMVDSWLAYNINLNSGHVRITQPEYELAERLLSLSHTVDAGLADQLAQLPDVSLATGRIRFAAQLTTADAGAAPGADAAAPLRVMGVGADLVAEDRVTRLSRYLTARDGSRLPTTGAAEVLLGADAMRQLGVKVGDYVIARVLTAAGEPRRVKLAVAGRLESGLKLLDAESAYVPLDTAAAILDMPDAFTEIVLFSPKPNTASGLARSVMGVGSVAAAGLKVTPWTRHSELIVWMSRVKAIYSMIYVFIVALSAFVVFNTLTMVVAERTREIGILAAMGLSPADIRRLFIAEGAIEAVVGSAAGALAGGAFNLGFSRAGFSIGSMTQGMGGEFLITSRLYPTASWGVVVFAFVLGIAVTVAAAWIPAATAGRLKPTEALRTV